MVLIVPVPGDRCNTFYFTKPYPVVFFYCLSLNTLALVDAITSSNLTLNIICRHQNIENLYISNSHRFEQYEAEINIKRVITFLNKNRLIRSVGYILLNNLWEQVHHVMHVLGV